MSRAVIRTIAALSVVATVACSDSLAPEDIVGTWEATSMTFTSVADPSTSVNLIAEGVEFEMTFTSGGVVTLTMTEDGDSETETGTWALDGDTFAITIEGDPSTGTIDLNGDTLIIMLVTGIEFDFDGMDEDATLRLVMTRV